MRVASAALCLAVASGCAGPIPQVHSTLFLPDLDGLAIEGSALRLDFGRAPSGVIAALTREIGPGRPLALDGCSKDIVRRLGWDEFELIFTEEQFVGWRSKTGRAGRVCSVAS